MTGGRLESLGVYNNRRREAHGMAEHRRTGIACPSCGNELLDSDPHTTLASDPPQKRVHCSECDYIGCRLA